MTLQATFSNADDANGKPEIRHAGRAVAHGTFGENGLQSGVAALYWESRRCVSRRQGRGTSGIAPVASMRIRGSSSGVEHHVANVVVVGSNPISRSCVLPSWDWPFRSSAWVAWWRIKPSRPDRRPRESSEMSTGEEERDASVSVSDQPADEQTDQEQRSQAEARDRRPDQGRRAVQEAPQGHGASDRDRASIRGFAGDLPA